MRMKSDLKPDIFRSVRCVADCPCRRGGCNTFPPWLHLSCGPSYYARRVMREDNRICEGLQSVAHQIERPPYLAALEERVGWFEQSYRQLVAEGDALLRDRG